MARITEVQKKLDETLLKALDSNIAAERIQATKILADRSDETKENLKLEIRALSDKLEFEKNSLKNLMTEREALTAKVADLQPLADSLPAIAVELDALKTNNAEWRATQMRELTAQSAQQLRSAEANNRAATEKLSIAERQFSATGLETLLTEMKKLVEQHDTKEPDFWSLPPNINPLMMTLWGWPLAKARVWGFLRTSFSEDTPGFRQAALRVFLATQPQYPGEPERETISDLPARVDFFREACARFNCLDEVQAQADEAHAARHNAWTRRNAAARQEAEIELSRKYGIGRDAFSVDPQSLSTVPLSEHLPGCVGPCCSGRGVQHATSLDEVI